MKTQQQTQKQSFKVPYQECKIHDEKLNYICLDPQCHQKSLICSICKDQAHHSKHSIRPLKFYLQELQEKYHKPDTSSNLNTLIQQLQLSQFTFYQNLKKAVQEVALEFQKLQEQVTQEINKIRSQIFQEMAKRNRFNEFYENLKRGNIDHSNFLIQNYLPQSSVGKIQNLQSLETLSFDICLQIQQTKQKLITRQSTEETAVAKEKKQPTVFVPLDLNTALKKPNNILFDGYVLKQTSIYGGKSLCLIDYPIQKISGKIGFKMVQLKKGATVIISIMPKKVFESMTNDIWANNKLQPGCYALANALYNYGWEKCEIVEFAQSSNLELSCKNGEIKIMQKNKSCKAKISSDVDLYIVISLTGESQVRLSHVK